MIFCVWFAALIVSLAPQFGWKDPEYMKRIEEQHCMVSQDVAYQVAIIITVEQMQNVHSSPFSLS